MVDGLIPFANSIPIIVVPGVAPYTAPLSVFPGWTNDAGIPSFGGARLISIFEDGGTEGVSTGNITAVTQAPIETVSGITMQAPDPSVLYVVRIRLRSAVNDPNYVDRVVRFRVVTPLMAPFALSTYDDAARPPIGYSGGFWKFTSWPTGAPSGEIRLFDGMGGIVLPNSTSNWPAEAQDHMNAMLRKLRATLVTIDFAPSGGVESWLRQTYAVAWNASAMTATSSMYRRKDFGSWGYFNGTDIDFIDATVDVINQAASVTFLRGLYAIGPRFNSLCVVGSKGSMAISPRAVQVGQQIDISQVIDFDRKSHLSQSGLADKFVLLMATTHDKIYTREIPLRPQGYWDFVAQDGVTNYWTSQYTTPSQLLLFCRVLFGDYIEFPNITQYYDPNSAFVPNPSTLPYPRVENINIYADNAITPNVVYADVVDLFDNMASIRMPEIGASRAVIDRRHLRVSGSFTAIPNTTAFLRIVMDIRPDAVTAPYTVEAFYDLNWSGQPGSWKLPDVATPDAPILVVTPSPRALTVTIPSGSSISTSYMELFGDIGSVNVLDSFSPTSPSTHTLTDAVLKTIASDFCEMLELRYRVGSSYFSRRVALTTYASTMVTGTLPIVCYFCGGSIIFIDVDNVAVDGDGKKVVTIVSDGPPRVIRDVTESVPYFLNLQGSTPIGSGVRQPWVDLYYMAGGGPTLQVMRVYNNFFDARSGNPRTLSIQPVTGHSVAGVDYELMNFSAPGIRFHLATLEIEIENDSRVYDFMMWELACLSTNTKATFLESPTGGVRYAVGAVIAGASLGERLLLTCLHRSGTQKCFTVAVADVSAGFVRPVVVNLRPVL